MVSLDFCESKAIWYPNNHSLKPPTTAGDVKRGVSIGVYVVTLVVVLQDYLCLAGIGSETSTEGSLKSVCDFVLQSDVGGPLRSGGDTFGE